MATYTIYDPAMGMVPKTEPKRYTIVKAADALASKIYRFAPVYLSGGYAVHCAADATTVAGVALHHVDANPDGDVDLAICDDPMQIYECQADGAILQADVGKYIPLETVSGTNDHSTATFDESAAVATPTNATPFLIVGLVKTVNGPSTKFLCRIPQPQLSTDFDAVV